MFIFYMNTINISQKTKNKHLDFSHYEFIINSMIMFNASHSGKRNIGKTQFIKKLALDVGTSVSDIYSIIKDATVPIRDTHLNEHFELSALATFQKRSKNHKIPNNSKLEKACDFISLVENEVKSNRLSSIDETTNYLIIHQRDKINGMKTVSTKTFYNYVHQGKTSIKPIDFPRMVKKKTGRYISLKDKKSFLSLKDLNISALERSLVTGREIWLLVLEIDKMIKKTQDMTKRPATYTKATSYGAANYITNIEYDKKTREVIGKEFLLDKERIAEEEKYDGYYSIVTSEVELDDYEIRKIYRGLAKMEDTFKVTKSYLEVRPAFAWTKEHIEGHFLTCFVALVLVRLLERKLNYKYTVEQIIESTKTYNCVNIDKNIYQFLYKDEIIEDIGKAFDIDLDKKYRKRENIRRLLKY